MTATWHDEASGRDVLVSWEISGDTVSVTASTTDTDPVLCSRTEFSRLASTGWAHEVMTVVIKAVLEVPR